LRSGKGDRPIKGIALEGNVSSELWRAIALLDTPLDLLAAGQIAISLLPDGFKESDRFFCITLSFLPDS
jgi:hypothetical protein